MRTIQQPPEMPTFLEQGTYAYLSALDDYGWYRELARVYRLSVKKDLKLHQSHQKIKTTNNSDIVQISQPIITLFESINSTFFYDEQFPALLVSLDAPDHYIVEELKRELLRRRNRPGNPSSKPGKVSPNSRFDEYIFAQWINHKIIPLADALTWKASQPKQVQKKYPERQIGEWLGLNEAKDVSTSKKMLRDALRSLPNLFNQLPVSEK